MRFVIRRTTVHSIQIFPQQRSVLMRRNSKEKWPDKKLSLMISHITPLIINISSIARSLREIFLNNFELQVPAPETVVLWLLWQGVVKLLEQTLEIPPYWLIPIPSRTFKYPPTS